MLDALLGVVLAFFVGLDEPVDAPVSCQAGGAESAQQPIPCPIPPDGTDSTDDETGLIKVGGSGLIKVGGSG